MLTNFNYHKLPQIKSRTYLECWVNFSKYPHLGRTHVESCRCQSTDTSHGASTNQRTVLLSVVLVRDSKKGDKLTPSFVVPAFTLSVCVPFVVLPCDFNAFCEGMRTLFPWMAYIMPIYAERDSYPAPIFQKQTYMYIKIIDHRL